MCGEGIAPHLMSHRSASFSRTFLILAVVYYAHKSKYTLYEDIRILLVVYGNNMGDISIIVYSFLSVLNTHPFG